MLPCIDKEAVEAAESSKQKHRWKQDSAQQGFARDRWNKNSSRKADTDRDLLWQTVRALRRMDHHKVAEDQHAEDEIKMNCFLRETRKKRCQNNGSEADTAEEEFSMSTMKVM